MNSNLQISLQTLGIISLIFFVMAFACGDDNIDTQTSEEQARLEGNGEVSVSELLPLVAVFIAN